MRFYRALLHLYPAGFRAEYARGHGRDLRRAAPAHARPRGGRRPLRRRHLGRRAECHARARRPPAAGSALCRPNVAARQGLRRHGGRHHRTRRRRHHRRLLDHRPRAHPPVAVRRRRAPRESLGEGAAIRENGALARELPRLESAEHLVRGHGRVLGQAGKPRGLSRAAARRDDARRSESLPAARRDPRTRAAVRPGRRPRRRGGNTPGQPRALAVRVRRGSGRPWQGRPARRRELHRHRRDAAGLLVPQSFHPSLAALSVPGHGLRRPRQRLPPGGGQAQVRCHDRPGPGRADLDRRTARARLPEREFSDPGDSNPTAVRALPADQTSADGPLWCVAFGAAHRLYQPGQPAPRACPRTPVPSWPSARR